MKYLTRKEELVLLAIYRLEKEAYLVNIREYLNKNTSKRWSVGNVYVPLDRMSKSGFLEMTIGPPINKRGGKSIRYYKLTRQAIQALLHIKKVNDTMWDGIDLLAYEK